MVTHIPKPFVPRLLISMLIVSWANNRASLFFKPPPPSVSLPTHTYTLYLVLPFALEVRYHSYLPWWEAACALLSCWCFCCSVADCLAPCCWVQSPTWPGSFATWEDRGRVFQSYTILQERSKRICAYLTSSFRWRDYRALGCGEVMWLEIKRLDLGVTWWGINGAQRTLACLSDPESVCLLHTANIDFIFQLCVIESVRPRIWFVVVSLRSQLLVGCTAVTCRV